MSIGSWGLTRTCPSLVIALTRRCDWERACARRSAKERNSSSSSPTCSKNLSISRRFLPMGKSPPTGSACCNNFLATSSGSHSGLAGDPVKPVTKHSSASKFWSWGVSNRCRSRNSNRTVRLSTASVTLKPQHRYSNPASVVRFC